MRFYYQCAKPDRHFACGWNSAWQVFDRQATTWRGEAMAIALCVTMNRAKEICELLNKADKQ